MKSNVDNLESEMSRLTQNISKIATSSSAIHSSLGGKREKIRQLNGVHSLLTKVHSNTVEKNVLSFHYRSSNDAVAFRCPGGTSFNSCLSCQPTCTSAWKQSHIPKQSNRTAEHYIFYNTTSTSQSSLESSANARPSWCKLRKRSAKRCARTRYELLVFRKL